MDQTKCEAGQEDKPGCAPVSGSEYDYFEIEITRAQGTTIFLKARKGWKPTVRDRSIIGKAAKETLRYDEWEDDDMPGWERRIEIQSIKPITESEASHYTVFTVPEANTQNAPG